jgi:hypothetical protein
MLSFLFNSWKANLFPFLCLAAALLMISPPLAGAQVETSVQQAQKTELEIIKLRQEIAQLEKPAAKPGLDWDWWLGHVGSFIVGGLATWAGLRQRQGATDHPVHEKRLATYPELVKMTAPLAIYFQDTGGRDHVKLGPAKCGEIGHSMAKWYFDGGGILMSVEARNAYFSLAQALTRASKSNELLAPTFPDDSEHVSHKSVDVYRSLLFANIQPSLDRIDPTKTVFQRAASWLALNLRLQTYR